MDGRFRLSFPFGAFCNFSGANGSTSRGGVSLNSTSKTAALLIFPLGHFLHWTMMMGGRVIPPQKNCQVIQFVTFLSPSWRSLNHLKGHLTIPKRAQRIARYDFCPLFFSKNARDTDQDQKLYKFHWSRLDLSSVFDSVDEHGRCVMVVMSHPKMWVFLVSNLFQRMMIGHVYFWMNFS